MKGVNNLTKWEKVVEWFDDKKYNNLSEKTKSDLKNFRKINHYIKTLKNTIDEKEKEVQKLISEINKRKEKIRVHKNNGNDYYDKIVNLKKDVDITVYYSEGKRTKKLKGNNWSEYGSIKTYSQINIKYKPRNSKSMKTINIGTERGKVLNELKEVSPNWYDKTGKSLINLDWNNKSENNKIKNSFIKLFEPHIIKIISSSKNNTENLKITFNQLKGLIKHSKY